MNITQASQLVRLLERQKIDDSKPIKSQLHKIFVPAFWDGNLVLRSSWKGYIASLLERPSEYTANNKKIYQTFSEAIRFLITNPAATEKLNPALGFKLMDELCDESMNLNRNELDPAILSSPENQSLKKQKGDKRATYWNKIRGLSLLHKATHGNLSVELKTLRALKNYDAATNPLEALNFLEQFIKSNPAYAVLDWKGQLKRIRDACSLDEKILSQVQGNHTILKPEEKAQKLTKLLQNLSTDLTNLVASLDSSIGEKKLLHFSFGPKNLTPAAFLELMQKIPEPMLKPVSEQYKKILLSNDLQSIEKIGEKVVRAFFTRLKSSNATLTSLKPLGKDPSRRIPDSIASKLPKLFEIWLGNFLKAGVIGNASTFMPSKYSKVLEWISNNSDFLRDPAALEIIEEQFVELFKTHFKLFHQDHSNTFINFFKLSQTVVSPQIMEMLGIDHLMASGPLWLEFEKNADTTFNINVYTLGNSLNYHPVDLATGTQYAVMRLKNVKAEKLTKEFFFSLLKRHIEPIHDPLTASKAYDIYTGPLKTLEASIDNNLPGDPKGLESIPPTNWQLSLNLLLKQDSQKNKAILQIYFQALVGFCQPYMQNGWLNIQDVETCKTLESVLGQVDKYLKQTDLTSNEIKEIKATCTEVRHAIFNCYDSLKKIPINIKITTLAFDKELLKSLRQYILGFNISQKQLLEYRGTLTYFLGKEIGEFIDHILENSIHLLREDIPPSRDKPTGYFDQLYISMYASSIRHALQLAAIGIGLAHGGWMSLLAFGGFWYILPVPVLDQILPYALSSQNLDWYERIKDAILRKYYNLLVMGSLALIPKARRESIKKQILEWRKTVKGATSTLQGHRKLNYRLAFPIPRNKNGADPKDVNIKSNLFNTELKGLNRFCRVDQIHCQVLEGTDYISKITFNKDLSFTIKPNSKGALEAVSEKFPGFHIAEEQQEEALKEIPCYLLLQNQDSRKKVLIPKNQWMQTLIGRMAPLSGPFSEVWMSAAASINPKNDDYFIFDLEPCRYAKEKRILRSPDPEASLYLLCLYYFLNDKKALKQVQQHFNWICNNKPIPDKFLSQLIPLSLIPFNIAGLRQFRRQIFSVIAQNQLRFGSVSSSNNSATGGINLILGFVALMDLSTTSRGNLSIHQEYFLYKFSFKMLSSALKNCYHKLGSAAENGGLEALIELIGLSGDLNDRYLQIQKILGISENKRTWTAKKVAGILRTPSTLPEYGDQTEAYQPKNENYLNYITRLFSNCRNVKGTYLEFLKCNELSTSMGSDLYSIPSLKADEMTPELIKKRFPAYYSIARNDQSMKCSSAERQQLIYALTLLKGMGDKQSQILIHYLQTSILYGDQSPSTKNLVLALNKVKADPNSKSEWQKFFNEINDLTFGKLIEKDLVDTHLHSLTQFFGKQWTANAITDLIMTPQMLPPGLEQVGADVVAYTLKYLIAEKFLDLSEPLLKKVNSSEPFIERSDNNTMLRGISRVLNAAAPLCLIWTATDALSYFKPDSMASLPHAGEMESNLSYIAYQSLTIVGAAFLRIALAKAMKKKLKFSKVLPLSLPWYCMIAAQPFSELSSKAYNYIKPRLISWKNEKCYNFLSSLGEPYPESIERINIEYSLLEAADKAINQFLVEQYQLSFGDNALSEKSILALYVNLKNFHIKLAEHIKREKTEILDLFNTPIKFKEQNPPPLSLRDIEGLLEAGDFAILGKRTGLSNQDLPRIGFAVARNNHKKIRLKQIDQLLNEMTALLKQKSSPHDPEMLKQFGRNLQSSASSSLQNITSENIPRYLQHQASAKTNLVSFESFSNLPVAKAFQANKTKCILINNSDEMESVHQELWNIFGKRSYALKTSREMTLSPQQLQTILVTIKAILLKNETLQMSQEDLQGLQAIFIDRMYNYTHQKSARKPEDKDSLIFLKQILALVKVHGKAPDKSTLNHQLTYPIRKLKAIKDNFYYITEACIKQITQDPDLKPRLDANSLSTLNINAYHTTVKPRLAEKMSSYWRFKIVETSKQKEFIDFVCDRVKEVPLWIKENGDLYREISLVKGILHHMLPLRIAGKVPNKGTSMKIPYESIFNEGLTTAVSKLTQPQASELAKALIASAQNQMAKSKIEFDHTYVYKKFGDLSDISKLIQHPAACLFYMRYFTWKECNYWKYTIQNTPRDFEGLFDSPPLEPKQKAYNKILAAPDDSFAWMGIFEEHEDDLIDTTEDDPANLFGFTTYEANKPGFVSPLVDLGIQQKLELTKTQKEEKPTSKDSSIKTVQALPQTLFFQEWTWPATVNHVGLDWLKISSPSKKPTHRSECPFFKVQNLLFEAKSLALSKVAFSFDRRLWMSNNFVKRWDLTSNKSPADIGSSTQVKLEKVLVHFKKGDDMQIIGMAPLSPQEANSWQEKLSNKYEDQTSAAFIWNIAENRCEAGYQRGWLVPDFTTLINQLKFLNGDIDYPNQCPAMFEWVKTHSPYKLKDAFKKIYAERKNEAIDGHDIDHIFIKACNLNYEEKI
jgi:hypothetical protein